MNIKLVVVQGKPAGKALMFGPGTYFLGRGEECHLRFNSEWVSRQHCELQVTRWEATLRDLGSRNGTLVNGQLVGDQHPLREGDLVQIGPVVFEVQMEFTGEIPFRTRSEEVRSEDQQETRTGQRMFDSTAHHPALAPTKYQERRPETT